MRKGIGAIFSHVEDVKPSDSEERSLSIISSQMNYGASEAHAVFCAKSDELLPEDNG